MYSPLYRLIYVSRNEIKGDQGNIQTTIDQILKTARIKNAQVNITGALLFNAAYFAQILEGTSEAIEDTFERIECDERHSKVKILDFKQVENRIFTDWSMAYLGADSTASVEFAKILNASCFNLEKINGSSVVNLLKQHLLQVA
jgi:hypothetical protein